MCRVDIGACDIRAHSPEDRRPRRERSAPSSSWVDDALATTTTFARARRWTRAREGASTRVGTSAEAEAMLIVK